MTTSPVLTVDAHFQVLVAQAYSPLQPETLHPYAGEGAISSKKSETNHVVLPSKQANHGSQISRLGWENLSEPPFDGINPGFPTEI